MCQDEQSEDYEVTDTYRSGTDVIHYDTEGDQHAEVDYEPK
jgi:hypothetical protein